MTPLPSVTPPSNVPHEKYKIDWAFLYTHTVILLYIGGVERECEA